MEENGGKIAILLNDFQDMLEHRDIMDKNVLDRVKETEWSGDLKLQLEEGAREGLMGPAFIINGVYYLKDDNVCRAILVREWRPQGWRTQVCIITPSQDTIQLRSWEVA